MNLFKMCAKLILQSTLHEPNGAKGFFIFNKTQNLDDNNFNYLDIFWKLMVEDGKCETLALKSCNQIELIAFPLKKN
jgi:hypothetical protein